MKKYSCVFFCLFSSILFSQNAERPKIGLSLSGGGAKGLAHIGLLKALDSVGLDVDYVTGTSMGAIIGGLYSAGYSGNEIEEIAYQLDWDRLLSNKPPFDMLILPQKNNVGKYFEIPIVDGKLTLQRGLLESNELWMLLNELFYPYLTTEDFSDFPREFRCVATDFETGDAIVLKHGNIVKAVRASMAIPGAFTPVEIDGKTLIDGGIIMNFPVSEVRNMGADLVIGSSVTSPLLKSEDFNSPFQVITQLAFYTEKKDFQKQVESTDFFVDYPIEKFHTSSFSSANEIIEMGVRKGKEIFPELKHIKDSLDLLYGAQQLKERKRSNRETYHITNLSTSGLSKEQEEFFIQSVRFGSNEDYSANEITERIRTVFGSGKFRKINYEISEMGGKEQYGLNIDFQKKSQNVIIAGLHYNTDIGIALKLGYSAFGSSNPFADTSIEVAIGENPQMNITNLYFFNDRRTWYLESAIQGEYTQISVFNGLLEKTGLFNQQHLALEMKANNFIASNFTIGGGARFEYLKYTPEIKVYPIIKGHVNFLTSFLDLHFNNLESPVYPNYGNSVDVEVGFNYGIHPTYKYNDGMDTRYSPEFENKNYYTLKYYSAHYFPIDKHSIFLKLHSGIHFGNKQPMLNDFFVGGNQKVIRNQILFPGFHSNSIYSSSVASTQLGFQYNYSKKFVLSAITSYLKYDFVKSNVGIDKGYDKDALWGFAFAAGFKSFLGPIEAIFMYNEINNKVLPSFNLGYSLNF